MIELYLSSDGKHTVHVKADSPEQMDGLAPYAKDLYQKLLEEFGTKVQMWEAALNRKGNGQAQVGKRIDTVEQARAAVVSRCVVHQQVPMLRRRGPFGEFWSCPARRPDGRLCRITQGVWRPGNGQAVAA